MIKREKRQETDKAFQERREGRKGERRNDPITTSKSHQFRVRIQIAVSMALTSSLGATSLSMTPRRRA